MRGRGRKIREKIKSVLFCQGNVDNRKKIYYYNSNDGEDGEDDEVKKTLMIDRMIKEKKRKR